MKELDYMAVAPQCMEQIRKGAYLTVESEKGRNTMTIGWATIGVVWNRPIFTVAVRPTRHTFGIIEAADDFTVSIPGDDSHKKALAFCGSKSGRDYDKFAECDLKTEKAQTVGSPIISLSGIHYECRIVLKNAMDTSRMLPDLESVYPAKDYHTLYYGEVLACYQT